MVPAKKNNRFRLINVTHTTQNICELILNVLVDHGLGNSVIAVTLDNASANNVEIEILRPLVSSFHDELLETIQKIRQGILYFNTNDKQLASWKRYC